MATALTLLVYNILVCVLGLARCPIEDHNASVEETTCERCFDTAPSAPDDDPLARLDLRLGHWDDSRSFRTFDYAVVGDLYPEISATGRVCLATQSSIESLHEILKIAAHWTGPISVAVYIAADEMKLLRGFATWLFNCQPDIYSKLALHIATPAERQAVVVDIPNWARNCSAQPLPSRDRSEETIAWRARNPYPQNLLRNLARKNCQTSHVYLVDVDIVPCKGMAESLDKFLSKNDCARCAFVVPTYELDWSVARFPQNKTELLRLVKKKKAVAYHAKVFRANQQSSDLHKWEARNGKENSETHVSHNVTNFKMLYEPFYVAHDSVPPHDERFIGYGFTRNSQVYEMYLIGYQFRVLSPIFTIHWGLQSRKRPKWRMKQIWKNYKKFETFKKELYVRYGKDPLHLFTDKIKNTTKKLP